MTRQILSDVKATMDQQDDSSTVNSSASKQPKRPSRTDLMWGIVDVLRETTHTDTLQELRARVATQLGLTEWEQEWESSKGQGSRFAYDLRWASFELKNRDLIHYPNRGSRTLTELGRVSTDEQLAQLIGSREPELQEDEREEPDSSATKLTELMELIEQFLDETGYPTDVHNEQQALREEWAKKLAPENIASFTRSDLTAVTNHTVWFGQYLNPVEGEMKWIRDLDEAAYEALLDNIHYLCWSDDEISFRYDQLTSYTSPRKVNGFGDQNTSRVLAICLPQVFLPVGVQYDPWGRERMLRELGLPAPQGSTHGQRVIDSNDRLREHLKPWFADDTLGMATFLGWLLAQDSHDESDPDLARLAEQLLVDLHFLKDIVSLLDDKGQVILYGPPGTGKTYLARELAEVLAPAESRRALVQFHPSTSYEDFFEGYRPAETSKDGGIRYELTAGPLRRIAERASKAPGQRHVMIIDEINRGNLPRVLGELLFLLEYRDESVQTLYRPEKPFSLPDNLWFIGTMNTADRSIALVDAALRRRFHFVPFFPDREPMVGLLGRWLQRQDQPDWIGRLVDAVNDELKAALEGSHLLLGPSHFMKEYGSSPDEQRDRLRRIWEYNIEPFIEDQFFGNPQQIESFRFKAVWNRHGPATKSVVDADDVDDAESADGSEGEQAAADGAAALDA